MILSFNFRKMQNTTFHLRYNGSVQGLSATDRARRPGNIPLHFSADTGYSNKCYFLELYAAASPWRSRCGLPCGVQQRLGRRWLYSLGAGALRGELERPAAHGGQVHGGVVPAIDAAVRGMEGFGLRFVRAAPAGPRCSAALRPRRGADPEAGIFVGSVLGVHDAEDGLSRTFAQPGVHALVPALFGHPTQAAGSYSPA